MGNLLDDEADKISPFLSIIKPEKLSLPIGRIDSSIADGAVYIGCTDGDLYAPD
jgi:hypothetical protein